MYHNILIVLLLCIVSATTADDTFLVVTRKGNIIGSRKDGYNTFFGIPYALVNEENPFGVSNTFLFRLISLSLCINTVTRHRYMDFPQTQTKHCFRNKYESRILWKSRLFSLFLDHYNLGLYFLILFIYNIYGFFSRTSYHTQTSENRLLPTTPP